MTHVAFETAKRLKKAGFPQHGATKEARETIYEGESLRHPTATDILAHLPGWYLTFSKGEWACISFDEESNAPDTFRNSNPAEAVSEAWLFEQANARK